MYNLKINNNIHRTTRFYKKLVSINWSSLIHTVMSTRSFLFSRAFFILTYLKCGTTHMTHLYGSSTLQENMCYEKIDNHKTFISNFFTFKQVYTLWHNLILIIRLTLQHCSTVLEWTLIVPIKNIFPLKTAKIGLFRRHILECKENYIKSTKQYFRLLF